MATNVNSTGVWFGPRFDLSNNRLVHTIFVQ